MYVFVLSVGSAVVRVFSTEREAKRYVARQRASHIAFQRQWRREGRTPNANGSWFADGGQSRWTKAGYEVMDTRITPAPMDAEVTDGADARRPGKDV